MKRNRFLKKTVVKWIISLVLFISITVIVISISLYKWYAGDNITLYNNMSESTLNNISKAIETLDTSLKNAGFLAVNDTDYKDMMYSNSMNTWLHGVLQQKIMNLIFTNPMISSAYLVNKKANWVIGSPSPAWIQAGPYSDSVNAQVRDQKQEAIIRINTYKTQVYEVNNKAVIDDTFSYLFFLTRQNTAEDSFLILNVKQSSMVEMLDNINTMPDSKVIVTDGKGRVVLSQDPGQLYKEYGGEKIMRQIIESKNLSGYFDYTENSEKSLVTYVKSDKTDFYFVSITPFEIVRKTSIELRNRTLVLSIVISIIGLIAAIIISFYFYSPLKRLMNKYVLNNNIGTQTNPLEYKNEYEMLDKLIEHNYRQAASLDSFVNDNLPIIKQDYLKKILEGKINIKQEFSREKLFDINVNLAYDHYQVIYIIIDNADDLKKSTVEILDLKRNICKSAEDTFKLICSCETVWEMSDESAAIILNYRESNTDIHEKIKYACKSLQEHSQAVWGIKLTLAIGKESINDVHGSFQDAVELSRYKLKYGDCSVIDQERVDNNIAGYDLFPENEEKYLLRSLRSLSLDSTGDCIRQIVRQFYSYSINDILRAVNHILYSTFHLIREMLKNKDVSSEIDFFYAYERLTKYKSLHEMEDNLISFYESIIRDMERTLKGDDDGHSVIIKRVLDHIKKDYANPAISLESVADYVNLNPSYLGKIFKESTGVYFTEYINNLRLEAAKELLANTNESINHISSLVGFNSTTYFVTCFKKYTGLTPAKYR